MIVFIVQSANSLLEDKGYGKSMFMAEHPHVLVTFADQDFQRRHTILPSQQPTNQEGNQNEQVHRQP